MEWKQEAPAMPCPGSVPWILNAWVAYSGKELFLPFPSKSSCHKPSQRVGPIALVLLTYSNYLVGWVSL